MNGSPGLFSGEDLVVPVKNDPKFPHATYKCTMCDCYFNDEYARKGHVKGRRHRLNYKKMYQPDLYVEPTKQQKKEMEKRKRTSSPASSATARALRVVWSRPTFPLTVVIPARSP